MKFNHAGTDIVEVPVPLVPHSAQTSIELLEDETPNPIILLSIEAYVDTYHIITAAGDNEVGWLGSVQQLGDDRYLIDKVFMFNQHVSGGHCEFDQTDMGKFYAEKLKQDRANKDLLSSILFWGHLHPGDMTWPSLQDEEQMQVFAHNTFFIRGIFTRGGKCVFTFFDYARGIKINDCPWQIHIQHNTQRYAEIIGEIEQKVRDIKPVRPRYYKEPRHGKKHIS